LISTVWAAPVSAEATTATAKASFWVLLIVMCGFLLMMGI